MAHIVDIIWRNERNSKAWFDYIIDIFRMVTQFAETNMAIVMCVIRYIIFQCIPCYSSNQLSAHWPHLMDIWIHVFHFDSFVNDCIIQPITVNVINYCENFGIVISSIGTSSVRDHIRRHMVTIIQVTIIQTKWSKWLKW